MAEENKSLESVSFEESLAELEAIVDRLESGKGSLDEAIKAYERGSELKRYCQTKLDEARMKVEKIRLPENGNKSEISDFE